MRSHRWSVINPRDNTLTTRFAGVRLRLGTELLRDNHSSCRHSDDGRMMRLGGHDGAARVHSGTARVHGSTRINSRCCSRVYCGWMDRVSWLRLLWCRVLWLRLWWSVWRRISGILSYYCRTVINFFGWKKKMNCECKIFHFYDLLQKPANYRWRSVKFGKINVVIIVYPVWFITVLSPPPLFLKKM